MTQLSYQPAFDPFHSVFRILRLFGIIRAHGSLHRDSVRILDYFLLFPFRINSIRLKREHRKYRSLAAAYEFTRPYGDQPDDKTVFDRMVPMQDAAFETLAVKGLLEASELSLGMILVVGRPDASLEARTDRANRSAVELMEFLAVLATEYETSGPDGLKARTQLLEHRYDAV